MVINLGSGLEGFRRRVGTGTTSGRPPSSITNSHEEKMRDRSLKILGNAPFSFAFESTAMLDVVSFIFI